jgi:hypothetical protein
MRRISLCRFGLCPEAGDVVPLARKARRDPDAIEAVFRKLNAVDEAEAARRDLCG